MTISQSFCTKDDRKRTFSSVYSEDVEEFQDKWAAWVSNKGNIFQLFFFYLLTLVIGVGSTPANQKPDDEDEEPSSTSWTRLLEEMDGIYSLKPLAEVEEMNPNKVHLSLAFREIVRQAWSKYYLIVNYLSS